MAANFEISDSGSCFAVFFDDRGEAAIAAWFDLYGARCRAAGITYSERATLSDVTNTLTRAYVEDLARTLKPHARGVCEAQLSVAAHRIVRSHQTAVHGAPLKAPVTGRVNQY